MLVKKEDFKVWVDLRDGPKWLHSTIVEKPGPVFLSRRARPGREPPHQSGIEFQEGPRVTTPDPYAKVAYKPPLPIVE